MASKTVGPVGAFLHAVRAQLASVSVRTRIPLSARPGFWYWARAALAFRPIHDPAPPRHTPPRRTVTTPTYGTDLPPAPPTSRRHHTGMATGAAPQIDLDPLPQRPHRRPREAVATQGTGVMLQCDLPPLFRVNDQQALARQRESLQVVGLHLTGLLLAATAAVLAEQLDSRVWAALAAVLYGLTILVSLRAARRRARAAWHVHRAAAEMVKSMAWRYMAGGRPFHPSVADPDALFAERLEESLSELRKIGWEDSRTSAAMGRGQITPAMRTVRAKPFEARRDIYLRDRLRGQAQWYRAASDRARRAWVVWSAVTFGLTLLALLAAALRAAGLSGGWNLTGLLSAATAAGLAWQEVRRHRPLSYAHALVGQDLETLRIAMSTTVTEEGWADAVAEAERLASPQHTDWLVRFGS